MLLLKSAIRVSSPEFTKHHNLFDSIMCQSPGPNSLAVGFAVKTFGSSLEQYLQSKKLFCMMEPICTYKTVSARCRPPQVALSQGQEAALNYTEQPEMLFHQTQMHYNTTVGC